GGAGPRGVGDAPRPAPPAPGPARGRAPTPRTRDGGRRRTPRAPAGLMAPVSCSRPRGRVYVVSNSRSIRSRMHQRMSCGTLHSRSVASAARTSYIGGLTQSLIGTVYCAFARGATGRKVVAMATPTLHAPIRPDYDLGTMCVTPIDTPRSCSRHPCGDWASKPRTDRRGQCPGEGSRRGVDPLTCPSGNWAPIPDRLGTTPPRGAGSGCARRVPHRWRLDPAATQATPHADPPIATTTGGGARSGGRPGAPGGGGRAPAPGRALVR